MRCTRMKLVRTCSACAAFCNAACPIEKGYAPVHARACARMRTQPCAGVHGSQQLIIIIILAAGAAAAAAQLRLHASLCY